MFSRNGLLSQMQNEEQVQKFLPCLFRRNVWIVLAICSSILIIIRIFPIMDFCPFIFSFFLPFVQRYCLGNRPDADAMFVGAANYIYVYILV